LVYDEHLERQVAVKVPHRRLVLDPKAAASYLDEARAAAPPRTSTTRTSCRSTTS
jgi:hypothetical protein